MPIDLTGKTIVITGASSGIGAAAAMACARAGMRVAIGARRVEKLDRLVAEIERSGGKALARATDVTDARQCEALVDEAAAKLGGGSVYAVFANAGYGEEIAIDRMSDSALRTMFETNFFGSLNVIRPALARMRQSPAGNPRGHILICSSCLARMAIPYYGAYCATKAAQAHIGSAMRFELEPEGIHVSTVHPVGTSTEFFEQVEKGSAHAKLVSHSPDALMQSPEFVAGRIVACLRRPRAEVWTGLQGGFVRFGMSVCTLLPGMGSAVLRGMVKRRMRLERARAGPASPAQG